jgi:hypothetical protein
MSEVHFTIRTAIHGKVADDESIKWSVNQTNESVSELNDEFDNISSDLNTSEFENTSLSTLNKREVEEHLDLSKETGDIIDKIMEDIFGNSN